MHRVSTIFPLVCFCFVLTGGCTRLALRLSPALLGNFAATIFEECDSTLAKEAIPGNLKLMEGLLRSDPENKKILHLLSMGFSGYSMLFLEREEPQRASQFFRRALDYGIRGLGSNGDAIKNRGTPEQVKRALGKVGEKDFEALFWTGVALSAWINLNLDKPTALVQMNILDAIYGRILEIDEGYLYGFPHVLIGANLSARPPMFGGNTEKAKIHFEKALALGEGKFFLTHYFFARYYTTRVQDKEKFLDLIDTIDKGDPSGLKDVCLINTMMQKEARILKEESDELFF